MVVQMGDYQEQPMSEIERPTGGVFDDPLATRINRKYRQVESSARSTVEAGIELGGMLLEKKTALRHGEWLPWVRAYFEGSERQAQRFMQLYSERDKLLQNPTRVSDLGFREALRAISPPSKEDQKEDSTKLGKKFAKWFAAFPETALTPEEPGQDAITRKRVEGPLRGASDHGAVPAEPREPTANETKVWSDEERELLARLQSGETVAVNMLSSLQADYRAGRLDAQGEEQFEAIVLELARLYKIR
jgi:hypothetical protein